MPTVCKLNAFPAVLENNLERSGNGKELDTYQEIYKMMSIIDGNIRK